MHIKDNIWFQVLQPVSVPTKRIFCMPYAGGSASAFASWQEDFSFNVEVCSIQLPGHFGRMHEPCINRLGKMISQLLQAMRPYLADCPYYFFGHSMGARVAFEIACAIKKEGLPGPRELFVSGARAPHLPRKRKIIHDLPHDEFIEEVDKINGTPKEVFENNELLELILPILRADFAVCETWEEKIEDILDCPLRVFGGLNDPGVDLEDLDAWQECSSSEFKRHMFPGDHFFIQPHKKALLRIIEKHILSLQN